MRLPPRKYLKIIYYAFIFHYFEKGVKNLSDVESKRQIISKNTTKLLGTDTINTLNKEASLRSIYKEDDSLPFKQVTDGVSEIKFIIHQKFTLKIPMEILFTIMQATDITPVIRINPSTHKENNYKLYGESYTNDGRLVPILKNKIYQIANLMGNTKGVSSFFPNK